MKMAQMVKSRDIRIIFNRRFPSALARYSFLAALWACITLY